MFDQLFEADDKDVWNPSMSYDHRYYTESPARVGSTAVTQLAEIKTRRTTMTTEQIFGYVRPVTEVYTAKA